VKYTEPVGVHTSVLSEGRGDVGNLCNLFIANHLEERYKALAGFPAGAFYFWLWGADGNRTTGIERLDRVHEAIDRHAVDRLQILGGVPR
jgi:hypothetical protein